jgi:WD40 repeat protein
LPLSGNRLALCGSGSHIEIWLLESNSSELINLLEVDKSTNSTILVEDKMISASQNERIKVWDSNSYSYLSYFKGYDGKISQIFVSLPNNDIASCGIDNTIKVWDYKMIIRKYKSL